MSCWSSTTPVAHRSSEPRPVAVRRDCRGCVLRGRDAGTDRFLPDVVPGLVVGVIRVDSVIALLGDFRRRGEGHTSLEAT